MEYPTKNPNTPINSREYDDALLNHLIVALQPYPAARYDEGHVERRESFLHFYLEHTGHHSPHRPDYLN